MKTTRTDAVHRADGLVELVGNAGVVGRRRGGRLRFRAVRRRPGAGPIHRGGGWSGLGGRRPLAVAHLLVSCDCAAY